MYEADRVFNRGLLFHSGCATGSLSDLNLELGLKPLVNAADARAMDIFLGSVERRAFRIAQIATRSRDDALDIVQDAMLQLSKRYGQRPPAEWAPLFHPRCDRWPDHFTFQGAHIEGLSVCGRATIQVLAVKTTA